MKRSAQIGLTAAGVLLVAGAWSILGGEGESLAYADAAECSAAGRLSPGECEARFAEAQAGHRRDAKRFPDTGACEAEFGPGRCETRTVNGASVVIPALAGMMLARSVFGGARPGAPLLPPTRAACPPGSLAPECQPISRGGSSTSVSGNTSWGRGSGSRAYTTTGGQPLVSTGGATRSSVTSRGGFGSTGHSFGSSSS